MCLCGRKNIGRSWAFIGVKKSSGGKSIDLRQARKGYDDGGCDGREKRE